MTYINVSHYCFDLRLAIIQNCQFPDCTIERHYIFLVARHGVDYVLTLEIFTCNDNDNDMYEIFDLNEIVLKHIVGMPIETISSRSIITCTLCN